MTEVPKNLLSDQDVELGDAAVAVMTDMFRSAARHMERTAFLAALATCSAKAVGNVIDELVAGDRLEARAVIGSYMVYSLLDVQFQEQAGEDDAIN